MKPTKRKIVQLLAMLLVLAVPKAMATDINNAMSDAWVSDNANFQGMFISVYKELGSVFVAWFTFDTEPPDEDLTAVVGATDHRWVTAFGDIDGDTVVLDAELTSGGSFNASQPVAGQEQGYGTITIVFADCENATVSYDLTGAGVAGEFQIHRIVNDNVALCEMLDSD